MNKQIANQVTFRGRITSKYKHPENKWLSLTLAVTSKTGVSDYPVVRFYGDMIDVVDKAYELKDHVEVVGIISRNMKYRTQSIIGIDINDTPRRLVEKFGIEESIGGYADDENEVLLHGEVKNIFVTDAKEDKNSGLAVFVIKTVIDNKTYYVQVTCFGHSFDKARNIVAGDNVYVIAHVQTTKKVSSNGPATYFQSIVCHYMEKDK